MRRSQHPVRRFFPVLALLCCLILLIASPYFIDDRNNLALRGTPVFAASRDSYSLSAPVRLLQSPVVDLESGTLSMPANRTGLAGKGEMLAMLITGKSARMTLNNATITTDFSTSDNILAEATPPAGGVAPLVAAFKQLQFDALGVRESAIRIKTADGSILLLEDVTADITAKPNGVMRAVGSFVFRGEKVNFDTTVHASSEPQGGARPITASIESEPLSAKLDGTLMTGESPRLQAPQAEISIPDLRRAARWLGADWRAGAGFEKFAIKGQLEWVNRAVAFQKASVRMDDNEASGTLSVSFAGTRPAIDGTLGLKTLNLVKYIPGGSQPVDAATPQESFLALVRKINGPEFPLIQTVDADLRISSDSVVAPRLTIGRSAVTISLKGGKLLADIAELELDEGTHGGGQVRIDASGPTPTYDIRGKLEALDVGRVATAVFGHPTVQGRGDVTVEITAAGNTGDAILRSLGGKLWVTLSESGLLGIDVNKLVAAVNAQQHEDVWRDASSGAIAVDKLDARFAVTEGKLRTETAEAQSGGRTMRAKGVVDLPARLIDVEFAIGDRTQADGAGPASKGEVIDMHGPWTDPAVRAASPKNPG